MTTEQNQNWIKDLVEVVQKNFDKQIQKSQDFDDSPNNHIYNDTSRINIRLFDTKYIFIKIQLTYRKNKFLEGKIIRYDEDAEISIRIIDKIKKSTLSNHMKKMIELIQTTTFVYVDIEYVPMRYVYNADIEVEDYYHNQKFKSKKQILKYQNMWLELGIIIDWNNWQNKYNSY